MPVGPAAAVLAYVIWGLYPLYLKRLSHVPALEVVVHRSFWSLLFLLAVLAWQRRFDWLRAVRGTPGLWHRSLAAAVLLSGNWLVYVWAVMHDHVLDSSLGYFINPLVNVALGFAVLKERPRAAQWVAVALAAAGVAWLTVAAGRLPWVALALGLSFGLYGLMRKTGALGALEGLTLETMLLAPVVLPAMAWLVFGGHGAFAHVDASTDLLLMVSGPLTAVPLLLFGFGARRITLASLGLLQYLSPSIQFLLGVFLYREPFDPARGVGFGLIWVALALYSAESLWRYRRDAAASAANSC